MDLHFALFLYVNGNLLKKCKGPTQAYKKYLRDAKLIGKRKKIKKHES
jgi:hypothetical protein